MHLTKRIEEETNLIAYYQFNRESGPETDRVGVRHLSFAGGALREKATGPWGGGVSAQKTIEGPGEYSFGTTGARMTFPDQSTYPGGEVVVSRIHLSPDELPDKDHPVNNHYWVVNNYGDVFFNPMSSLQLERIGEVYPSNVTDPSSIELHYRPWNAEGSTWVNWATASSAVEGQNGTASFESIQDLGQWSVVNTGETTAVELPQGPTQSMESLAVLYPNPVVRGGQISLLTMLEGPLDIRIWDATGLLKIREKVNGQDWTVSLDWPSGTYYFEISNNNQMVRGGIQIQE